MKKKTIAMLCMSALFATSLAACDFEEGTHEKIVKTEQSTKMDMKQSFINNFQRIQQAVEKVKLPSEKEYQKINGARALVNGDHLVIVYEFITKDNKYFDLSIEVGDSKYKRLASLPDVQKKKTPGKKEYLLHKNPNDQVMWMEDGKFYSIASPQLSEKQMVKIADSITDNKKASKVLSFDMKDIVFPKYMTRDDVKSPRRSMVEYFSDEQQLVISFGNAYATVSQSTDAHVIKDFFEGVKEYQKTRKENEAKLGKDYGHQYGDGATHSANPFYEVFEPIKLKDAEGYIQVNQELYSETILKKGDKYYHIRIEGHALSEKVKKDFYVKETQKIVDGLK
jgi:hypothetical protein